MKDKAILAQEAILEGGVEMDIQLFNNLKDGEQLRVDPKVLVDFVVAGKSGNRRRSKRNDGDLLKQSIKERGIIQPLVVRPSKHHEDKLELLGGYGRKKYAIELGLKDVPVLVRVVDDEEAYLIHMDENSKRSDLSLVDEVEQAKEFLTFYKGEVKDVAYRLGWTQKKVDERLSLGNCTEKVIDALEDNLIKAGHALLLSNFKGEVQNNTLKKVIAEKWTVEYLKQKAGLKQMKLSEARFDKADCGSCKHNSGEQNDLFGVSANNHLCSNPNCYRDKTVESSKITAEEKYGHVILLSTTSLDSLNTVSDETVGKEQFKSGCTGCENNVAVLGDTFETLAKVRKNQCTDQVCFSKLSTQYKTELEEANKQPEEIPQSEVGTNNVPTDTSTSGKKTTPKKQQKKSTSQKDVVIKCSEKAIEHHKVLLRQASVDHLKDNISLQKAIQLSALIKTVGYEKKDLLKGIECDIHLSFEQNVRGFRKLEPEELDKLLEHVTIFAMSDSKNSHSANMEKVMITSLADEADGKKVASQAWQPTKENLSIYTVIAIGSICDGSGLTAAFANAVPPIKANPKKGELIKQIISAEHDWTEFAPTFYLNDLKK